MEASKTPEILSFSVLNLSSLSPLGKEAVLAILHKAVSVPGTPKVTFDYSEFVENRLIDPTLSIEKIEDILQEIEKELISAYIYTWSLSASSLRSKIVPLFDSVSYGIQSYKDIRLTARIKKRFLGLLEKELQIQEKIARLTFKSKYSFPLLYLLENTDQRVLSKKQLHALFRAPKSYKAADLIRKVLNPAISDLAPLYDSLRVEKQIRRVSGKEEFYFSFRTEADNLTPLRKSTSRKPEGKKEILKRKESPKERLPLKRSEEIKIIPLKTREDGN